MILCIYFFNFNFPDGGGSTAISTDGFVEILSPFTVPTFSIFIFITIFYLHLKYDCMPFGILNVSEFLLLFQPYNDHCQYLRHPLLHCHPPELILVHIPHLLAIGLLLKNFYDAIFDCITNLNRIFNRIFYFILILL